LEIVLSSALVQQQSLGECPCRVIGEGSCTIVLVSAFPFSGALFDEVARRLSARARVVIPELHAGPDSGALSELVDRLVAVVNACGQVDVVAAHGLAVPVLLAAAERLPTSQFAIANGPVSRLDVFSATLSALGRAPGGRTSLASTLLRPGAFVRWLASSAGLRRAVVNPYVMDTDTVERLVRPLLETSESRKKIAHFLASLRPTVDRFEPGDRQITAIWGDADVLFPCSEAEYVANGRYHGMHVTVPGGRFLFPEERPWELADALLKALDLDPIDPVP
jgi:hypothetical protein